MYQKSTHSMMTIKVIEFWKTYTCRDANLLKIYLVFDAILRWQKKLIIWNTKLWKCKIEVRSSCQNFPLHCGNLTAILLIFITLRRSSTQWCILKNLIQKLDNIWHPNWEKFEMLFNNKSQLKSCKCLFYEHF